MKNIILFILISMLYSGCTTQREMKIANSNVPPSTKELFNDLKENLDKKFNLIEEREDCQFENILECFKICKEAKNSLMETKNTLLTMRSLQKDFDASDYIERYKRINSEYEKLQSMMTFSIQADTKVFKEVILSGLIAKKLQVLDKKENLNTHLSIMIKSKIKREVSKGMILAHAVISIIVKDFKGETIGSNRINITAKSTKSYDLAIESVVQKFNSVVYKDGIEKTIGLSL